MQRKKGSRLGLRKGGNYWGSEGKLITLKKYLIQRRVEFASWNRKKRIISSFTKDTEKIPNTQRKEGLEEGKGGTQKSGEWYKRVWANNAKIQKEVEAAGRWRPEKWNHQKNKRKMNDFGTSGKENEVVYLRRTQPGENWWGWKNLIE